MTHYKLNICYNLWSDVNYPIQFFRANSERESIAEILNKYLRFGLWNLSFHFSSCERNADGWDMLDELLSQRHNDCQVHKVLAFLPSTLFSQQLFQFSQHELFFLLLFALQAKYKVWENRTTICHRKTLHYYFKLRFDLADEFSHSDGVYIHWINGPPFPYCCGELFMDLDLLYLSWLPGLDHWNSQVEERVLH